MQKKKIYVGCALTHASQEFRDKVAELKDSLREDFEVLDFLGLAEGTCQDVYRHDIYNCVGRCDFFLAILDLPSTGLGWELGAATLKFNKPVLAVVHESVRLTRLAQGCDEPGYEVVVYRDLGEVADMVRARLAEPVPA